MPIVHVRDNLEQRQHLRWGTFIATSGANSFSTALAKTCSKPTTLILISAFGQVR
jgi:hypothetical protein